MRCVIRTTMLQTFLPLYPKKTVVYSFNLYLNDALLDCTSSLTYKLMTSYHDFR